MHKQLILMANSPGELNALARPVARAFSQIAPDIEIWLVITPCQFASGRELEVAKTFQGVTKIVSPKDAMKWIWWGKKPIGYLRRDKGAILFLGGDPTYPIILSRRLRYPTLAYLDHGNNWARFYAKCFIPDDALRSQFSFNGKSADRLQTVGDLMVDSMDELPNRTTLRQSLGLNPNALTVTFLPGSREFQIKHLVPLYLKAASMVRRENPSVQFVCSISPYTTIHDFKKSMNQARPKGLGIESYGTIVQQGGNRLLRSSKVSMIISDRYLETFAASDVCVTSPGTNTAQISTLGVPMVVVFPLQYPEAIPLEGLANIATQIPFVGRIIRKRFIARVLATRKYFALPNIKANRFIVPELVGDVSAEALAKTLLELLKNPDQRETMGNELRNALGARGAADRISRAVHEHLLERT